MTSLIHIMENHSIYIWYIKYSLQLLANAIHAKPEEQKWIIRMNTRWRNPIKYRLLFTSDDRPNCPTRYKRRKKHKFHFNIITALAAPEKHTDRGTTFDSDSFPIRIDNCATKCITNDKDDFEGSLRKTDKTIKGIGGTIHGIYQGTITWNIEDDDGKIHTE